MSGESTISLVDRAYIRENRNNDQIVSIMDEAEEESRLY